MKFSLLMGTRDRVTITAAIDAILAQDHWDWELLINDASEYPRDLSHPPYNDTRIRRWYFPHDRTFVSAMNQLMDESEGSMFCFVADDDVMEPGTLRYVDEIEEPWDWLVGRMLYGDGTGTYGHSGLLNMLLQGNFIPQPAVLWTRGAWRKIGPLDETLLYCQDYDYWIRLWKAFGRPKFVDRVITRYGVHPGQVTATHQHEISMEAERVRKKHRG